MADEFTNRTRLTVQHMLHDLPVFQIVRPSVCCCLVYQLVCYGKI